MQLLTKQLLKYQCIPYLLLCALTGCVSAPYGDMARCATLDASAERLACYDKMANHVGADQLDGQERIPRGWRIRTETSPIDDSRNVYLSIAANQAFVNSSERWILPTLVVRCKEDTTALIAAWGMSLGIGEAPILYRIDSQPDQTEIWQLSTANDAIGLWNGSAAIPFVKRLFGAEQLLLQVTPLGENSVTSTFEVAGLEQVNEPLRKACHW